APAATQTTAPPTTSDNTNRDTTTAPEVKEELSDVTKCRQSCEDDFNSCAKSVKSDSAYLACKTTYEECFNKCGQ
ncbi:hypothetical protein IT087_01550, partial [Candidatus Uhrbacteria bacterium]|nr:hypothetical protein [Candidatus Uhrbacteria bacterium]